MMVHVILPEPLLHRKDCVLLDADGCVRKRSLVRRSIHNQKIQGLSNTANSHASSSHADTNSAASASYSDADSYRYADSHSDANSYSYGYSNGDANSPTSTPTPTATPTAMATPTATPHLQRLQQHQPDSNSNANSLSVRQTDHRVFYVGSFEHSNRSHSRRVQCGEWIYH